MEDSIKEIPAGSKMNHGTRSAYVYGCHCDQCRSANTEYQKSANYRRRHLVHTPERVHGTKNGYANYGCRCERCRKANARTWLEWSHRRKK